MPHRAAHSAALASHHRVPDYDFGHLVRLANAGGLGDQLGLQRLKMKRTKQNHSRTQENGFEGILCGKQVFTFILFSSANPGVSVSGG